MEYIVHRRCREVAAYGERLNLPYGTRFETIGDFIADGNRAICATTSETAYKYFARNDDGNGLERGRLTHAIAYGKRRVGECFRFSEEEIEMLETKWSRFLRPDVDVILFNHDFFNAELPDLEELAAELEVKT